MNKKIAVFGIGGVGGYLASLLCNTYSNVTLVARNQRKEAIEKQGMILHSEFSGEITSHPYKVCTSQELEPQDIIFVSVKNYSLESVCEEIKHAIRDDTIIVPIMNGVDPGQRMRQYLQKGIVIDALIYIVSFANEDYSITQIGNYANLFIGKNNASDQEKEIIQEVCELLVNAKINCKVAEDIEAAIWKKYILNCAFNVATAYYDQSIGQLREDEKKSKEYRELILEAYEVCRAKNINVPQSDIDEILNKFYAYDYNATSSLLRDYRAHKKTEVETFSGYIVKEARKLNIDIPVSEKMYQGLISRDN